MRESHMYALNFYSPMVADQLRSRRKTATIRLGDKSQKYKKGMIVQVLAGARYSPRQKIFEAVIDKVEVKRLAELSPRDIEHDNPEIRRPEDLATFLGQLYNREVTENDTVTLDPLQRDPPDLSARACGWARRMRWAAGAPHHRPRTRPRKPTRTARRTRDSASGSPPDTAGRRPAARPRTRRSSAGRNRTRRQKATQSPSVLRRSSRNQSDALPTGLR